MSELEFSTEKIRGGYSKNRIAQRREQAKARQALRDARTSEQQLALLDERFGKGLGAEKERKRLNAKIEAAKNSNKNQKKGKKKAKAQDN